MMPLAINWTRFDRVRNDPSVGGAGGPRRVRSWTRKPEAAVISALIVQNSLWQPIEARGLSTGKFSRWGTLPSQGRRQSRSARPSVGK